MVAEDRFYCTGWRPITVIIFYRDNFIVFPLYCFDDLVSSCVALTQARLPKVSIFSEEYHDISTQACMCRAMETGSILLCFMGL